MSGLFDDIGDEPEALRQAVVSLTELRERTEHIGRLNRVVGRINEIEKRLVAIGGNSERELLPLLRHPSQKVRYSVAFAVKRFDRPLFIATLEALAREGDDVGDDAQSSLDQLEEIERRQRAPRTVPPVRPRIPFDWQEDNPPPSAMTEAEISNRLRESFPPDLATKLLTLVRPTIDLWPNATEAPPPLGTRMGGRPIAPLDWRWPLYEEEPLFFLAQIHCPDLAGLPGAELLPQQGMLAFFADHDAIAGCGWGVDPEQGAVFHWPNLDELCPVEPPLNWEEEPKEQAVTLRSRLDLPDRWSDAIKSLGLSDELLGIYAKLREALIHHGEPEEVRYYCGETKLLGWPTQVQADFGFGTGTGAHPWRLLFQFGCHIGPGGNGYFMIREDDLTAGRFDQGQIETQCT